MRPIRLILCCCLLLAACHKHVPVAVVLPPPALPPPPTVATPPPVVAPLPVPVPKPPVVPPLGDADRAFTAGNCDDAAHLYEDYLRENPTGGLRDQALFNLAMSLLCRAPIPTATDWTKATPVLKELVDGYPTSPLRPAAALILSQRSDIDQLNVDIKQKNQTIQKLNQDLERLKTVDRRRKP